MTKQPSGKKSKKMIFSKIILTRNFTLIPLKKKLLNFIQYILSYYRNKNYEFFLNFCITHGYIQKFKKK